MLFIISIIGICASGYLGMYEVLLEIAVISWILRDPKVVLGDLHEPSSQKSGEGGFAERTAAWLVDHKKRTLSGAIRGEAPLSDLIVIVLLGVLVGWGLTLLGVLFRPWQTVLTREIAETLLDFVIFIPGLILATEYFKVDLEDALSTQRFRKLREDHPDDMGVSLWKMMHMQEIIAQGGYEYWEMDKDADDDARAEERLANHWRRLTYFTIGVFLLGLGAHYSSSVDLLLLLERWMF